MFSHGRLRTFQKGDPWYILKLGNHKIIETKAGMKKGMGVQIYFQGCSKCTCVWSIFPSHLEGKFSVENREISSETLQRVLVFPKLLYLPQPLKCVMKSLSWACGLSGRRYVWRNVARQELWNRSFLGSFPMVSFGYRVSKITAFSPCRWPKVTESHTIETGGVSCHLH